MSRRSLFIVLGLLVLATGFWWVGWYRGEQPLAPLTPTPVSEVPVSSVPVINSPSTLIKPKPVKPVKQTTAPPKAPDVKLHTELIPKNIEIVRCYYSQEIAPPGTSFGFDINGSGFTSEFQKMIKVDPSHPGVTVKNLKLVTANQIHGEMVVGTPAKTSFVYPRVLIKSLPVFQAPEPFAVIRKGEVLNVVFTRMEDNGRAGIFRVFTHLDDALANTFRVEPSTPGITISDIRLQLPYIVEGLMGIGPRVPTGDYGLKIFLGEKKIFERTGMIRIVRPNVGQNGFVQGLSVTELYRRPGDAVDFYVIGTGIQPADVSELSVRVSGFDVGKGSFTYINPTQIRLSVQVPPQAPLGSYAVTILGREATLLFERKDALKLIPANWIAGVQLTPPIHPGETGVLRILGRDFSQDFAGALSIGLDEPGITLSGLRLQDAGTLSADIAIKGDVRPGDYWLQLKIQGKKIDPPYGSIIKIQPKP